MVFEIRAEYILHRSEGSGAQFHIVGTHIHICGQVLHIEVGAFAEVPQIGKLLIRQTHRVRAVRISPAQQLKIGGDPFQSRLKQVFALAVHPFVLQLMGVLKVVKNGSRLAHDGDGRTGRVLHRHRRRGFIDRLAVIPAEITVLVVQLPADFAANLVLVFYRKKIGIVVLRRTG